MQPNHENYISPGTENSAVDSRELNPQTKKTGANELLGCGIIGFSSEACYRVFIPNAYQLTTSKK